MFLNYSLKRASSMSVLSAQFNEQSLITNLMGLRGRTSSTELLRSTSKS